MFDFTPYLTQPVALMALSVLQTLLLGVIAVRGRRRPPRQPRQYILNAPPEEQVAATHVAPPAQPQLSRQEWKRQMARRFNS